jgi:Lectin C-type domain
MYTAKASFLVRVARALLGLGGLFFALEGASAHAQTEWTVASGGNGHFYQLVATSLTWPQARDSAAALSFGGFTGHLVTLSSQAENNFLRDTFGVTGWIGLSQPPGSQEPAGGWAWVTGEVFGFSNWQPGEPNNLGNELYTEMLIGEQWNDVSATSTNFYYVEYGTNLSGATAPEPSTSALLTLASAPYLYSLHGMRCRRRLSPR